MLQLKTPRPSQIRPKLSVASAPAWGPVGQAPPGRRARDSVVEPLARRRSNPVTAGALVGALISGLLSLGLVLRAMVTTAPLA